MKITSMEYARFKTEDELIKSILHSLFYDAYPKVSAIGGKKINPDIDILEAKKISKNQTQLIGYEVKLMRFDKRSKGLSWSKFYNGIGQAFLYLKSGVHRAVLVLGFHEDVSNDKLIDEFCNSIQDDKDLFKRIFGSYISIGVHRYEGGSIFLLVDQDCDFYPSDEKVRLRSNELLQGKFTYNSRLKSD